MHFKFLKNVYCPCPADPVSLNFDPEKKSFAEKTIPVYQHWKVSANHLINYFRPLSKLDLVLFSIQILPRAKDIYVYFCKGELWFEVSFRDGPQNKTKKNKKHILINIYHFHAGCLWRIYFDFVCHNMIYVVIL